MFLRLCIRTIVTLLRLLIYKKIALGITLEVFLLSKPDSR